MPSKAKAKMLASVQSDGVVERELKAFYHGQPDDPISTARFYWAKGEGPRESIVDHFLRKRRPAAREGDADTAARVEVLLRSDVPDDYADPQSLAESYMSKLPPDETAAFAQITVRFPHATNLHAPWHRATSWLRNEFVDRVGVPVLAVLHAPFLVGSESSVHIHALVLMRRATCFGWLGSHRDLASDAGLAASEASWRDWLAN